MTQYDPQWLDSMYNNRALVPDYATYFERWQSESQAARSNLPCKLDVAYGKAGGEKLDIFPTETASKNKTAPVRSEERRVGKEC